jgi:hypothetical protein
MYTAEAWQAPESSGDAARSAGGNEKRNLARKCRTSPVLVLRRDVLKEQSNAALAANGTVQIVVP